MALGVALDALGREGGRGELALSLPELAVRGEEALPQGPTQDPRVVVAAHRRRVQDEHLLDVVGVVEEEPARATDLEGNEVAVLLHGVLEECEGRAKRSRRGS
jgi:hypothetical protein